MKSMIFAIDFDGTCVTHAYPNMGEDIGAASVMKAITDAGHKIILYTMRSEKLLDDAVQWFEKNNIPIWAVNNNPQQHIWTKSKKIYANFYIDDAAMGCPLVCNKSGRPYVNWPVIRMMLEGNQVI